MKLPEGRSEKSCFLREPLALPSESLTSGGDVRLEELRVRPLESTRYFQDGLVSERMRVVQLLAINDSHHDHL